MQWVCHLPAWEEVYRYTHLRSRFERFAVLAEDPYSPPKPGESSHREARITGQRSNLASPAFFWPEPGQPQVYIERRLLATRGPDGPHSDQDFPDLPTALRGTSEHILVRKGLGKTTALLYGFWSTYQEYVSGDGSSYIPYWLYPGDEVLREDWLARCPPVLFFVDLHEFSAQSRLDLVRRMATIAKTPGCQHHRFVIAYRGWLGPDTDRVVQKLEEFVTHVFEVEPLTAEEAVGCWMERGFSEEEIRRLSQILEDHVEEIQASKVQPRALGPIFTIPDFPDFFGRKADLEDLETFVQTSSVVLTWGEPGVGKTYLAAQLAKKLSEGYQVCWVDGEGLTLDGLLFQANEFLKSTGEYGFVATYGDQEVESGTKTAVLVQVLSRRNDVFFIDNFQRADRSGLQPFLERFSAHGGMSRLVLVDQSPLHVELGPSLATKMRRFPVRGLHKEDAIGYIRERSKGSGIEWPEAELAEVFGKTAGHPLAMSLIVQCCLAGATLEDVLGRLVEYDKRSGAELHQRLLEDVAAQLDGSEKEALHRLAVFRTPVQRLAWKYLDIPTEVGESLLWRRLLEPVGRDKFQMHPLLREFWYADREDMALWHEKAARYYEEQGTQSPLNSLDLLAYLEAHHHFTSIGQDEPAGWVVNDLVHRLHEQERLPSERLPDLKTWILSLGDAILDDKPWLLFEKGRKLEREGRREEAEAVFRRAHVAFEGQGDELGASVALYYVGKMLHLQKKAKPALEPLQSALIIAKSRADMPMQIRTLGKIIDCYADLGRYGDAEVAAIDADELVKKYGDKLGRALTLYRMGKIERRRSNFSDAANFLNECAKAFEELGDIYRQSKALSRLGIVQGFQGDYAEATTSFERAIELKRVIDDRHGLARDLDYLADIYTFRGRYREAEARYKQSLAIKRGSDDLRPDLYGQIKAYNNLSRMAVLTGRLSEAEVFLQESAKRIDKRNKQHIGVAGTRLNNLGDLQFARGEYQEALRSYKAAAVCFVPPHPEVPHSYARALFNLGRTYLEMRELGQAKRHLEAALAIFQKHGMAYYEALALTHLTRLKVVTGRVEEAIVKNREAIRIAREKGAQHVLVVCLETQGLIEETQVLKSFAFEGIKVDQRGQVTESLIDRVWKHYDEAIHKAKELAVSRDIARLKVKKHLWLFTVKLLCGEPVSSDDAYGLLVAETFAREIMYLELLSAKHAMRILHSISPRLAARLADRTLRMLSPLAMRFGFNALREEMDELAFAFLYPTEYQEIAQALESRFPNRKGFIQKTLEKLEGSPPTSEDSPEKEGRLKKVGVQADVIPRAKSLYSIYGKQKARGVPLSEILDLVGFRIITRTEKDCYKALAVVQDMGSLFEGEGILAEPIRDYIQNPKKTTGYRSIHVNIELSEPEPRIVEFQIRTLEMHLAAEVGFSALGLDQAAHWRYKDVGAYARPSLAKAYELAQREKVRVRLAIECEQSLVGTVGEVLRSFTGLEILPVDIDRVETEESEPLFGKRIVLWLELGPKARGRQAQDYMDTVLDKLVDALRDRISNCRVLVVGDQEEESEIKVVKLSLEEKAELLYELTAPSRKFVYVLTPRGDVRKLRAGSTVLDFAYRIHTELGHQCMAARVNGNWEPIDHVLRTGDRVEIITGHREGPSRDWLDIVRTRQARAKIKQWFRRHGREEAIRRGRTKVESALKLLGAGGVTNKAINGLAAYYGYLHNYTSVDDFLAALGHGDLSRDSIKGFLLSAKGALEALEYESVSELLEALASRTVTPRQVRAAILKNEGRR